MKEIKLKINGMHCTSCALNIERTVEKIKGVKKIEINFINSNGYINATDKTDIDQIINTIKKLGYDAVAEVSDEKKTLKKI